MNSTTVTPDLAAFVAGLHQQYASRPADQVVVVEEGDPFWHEPDATIVKPVSLFDAKRAQELRAGIDLPVAGEQFFCKAYDGRGNQVPVTGDLWKPLYEELELAGLREVFWARENVVVAVGHLIYVSGGSRYCTAEQDGQFVFESLQTVVERQRAERDAERAELEPAIRAAMPAWAAEFYLNDDEVDYESEHVKIGDLPAYLGLEAQIDPDTRQVTITGEPTVYFGDNEFTPAEFVEQVAILTGAAAEFEKSVSGAE